METHPCTLIYLSDGTKYAVVEEIDEIARRVRECRARTVTAVYRIVDPPASVPSRAARTVPAAVVPLRSRQER